MKRRFTPPRHRTLQSLTGTLLITTLVRCAQCPPHHHPDLHGHHKQLPCELHDPTEAAHHSGSDLQKRDHTSQEAIDAYYPKHHSDHYIHCKHDHKKRMMHHSDTPNAERTSGESNESDHAKEIPTTHHKKQHSDYFIHCKHRHKKSAQHTIESDSTEIDQNKVESPLTAEHASVAETPEPVAETPTTSDKSESAPSTDKLHDQTADAPKSPLSAESATPAVSPEQQDKTDIAPSTPIQYTCQLGEATRTISVVNNPTASLACEVVYEKSSSTQSLWSAQHDIQYCQDQALAFAHKQMGWGWHCVDHEGNKIE